MTFFLPRGYNTAPPNKRSYITACGARPDSGVSTKAPLGHVRATIRIRDSAAILRMDLELVVVILLRGKGGVVSS